MALTTIPVRQPSEVEAVTNESAPSMAVISPECERGEVGTNGSSLSDDQETLRRLASEVQAQTDERIRQQQWIPLDFQFKSESFKIYPFPGYTFVEIPRHIFEWFAPILGTHTNVIPLAVAISLAYDMANIARLCEKKYLAEVMAEFTEALRMAIKIDIDAMQDWQLLCSECLRTSEDELLTNYYICVLQYLLGKDVIVTYSPDTLLVSAAGQNRCRVRVDGVMRDHTIDAVIIEFQHPTNCLFLRAVVPTHLLPNLNQLGVQVELGGGRLWKHWHSLDGWRDQQNGLNKQMQEGDGRGQEHSEDSRAIEKMWLRMQVHAGVGIGYNTTGTDYEYIGKYWQRHGLRVGNANPMAKSANSVDSIALPS